MFVLCSALCSAASSGGGSAAVSQGAAGGPAEVSATGTEGGGAGGEECVDGGRERAAGQAPGGKCLCNVIQWSRTFRHFFGEKFVNAESQFCISQPQESLGLTIFTLQGFLSR